MGKDARPQLPSGESPRMFFARCVWRCIWGGRFPFRDTDTVKVDNSGGFYSFNAKTARTGIAGGSFRGEYSPSTAYGPQDMVIVSTGSNSGTYICIGASTGNNPWAGGGYWVQLPSGNNSTWM